MEMVGHDDELMQQVLILLVVIENHLQQQLAHALGLQIEPLFECLGCNKEDRCTGKTSREGQFDLTG